MLCFTLTLLYATVLAIPGILPPQLNSTSPSNASYSGSLTCTTADVAFSIVKYIQASEYCTEYVSLDVAYTTITLSTSKCLP
jgi:hypothetical protein